MSGFILPVPVTGKALAEFVGTLHHFSSGVYIKEMRLPKDHYVVTHRHSYDHFGLLGSGKVIIELDDVKTEFSGPCVIEIKSGVKHKITAIEDIVWFCIHATDVTDPEKVDQVLIRKD